MMRARASSWLLLCLVVLVALVVAELYFEVGVVSGKQPMGPGSAPSETSPIPMFALADRESFSETLTRPLFMPNRQPPEALATQPSAPASRGAQPKANRYALSAIIIVDNERIALLTDTATGGLSRVREGESLAGWQVEEIHADGAVLSNGDKREELSLRSFAAPMPRAPAQGSGVASDRPAGSAAEVLPNRPRRPKRGPREAVKIPRAPDN